MNGEKNQISGKHLTFSVACFVIGSILLTAFMYGITKQDTWMTVVLGFVFSLPILAIYLALVRKFPEENLAQMSERVFGPVVGKIYSLMFIFYFYSLTSFNSGDVGNFVVERILPGTPLIAVLIVFILVCAYAVRKGIQVLVGYSFVFLLISMIVLVSNILLLLKDFRIENFLPVFHLSPLQLIQGTHVVAIVPLGETMAFLMVIPALKNKREARKAWLGGLTIGAAFLLLIIMRDIVVLGGTAPMMTLPSFEAVRLIQIGDVFSRMEILYAFMILMELFIKVTFLYYATVVALKQVFGLKSYRPLVIPVGILTILFAMVAFDSGMQHTAWGTNEAAIYASFFELVLPLLLLAVALIRRLPKGGKEEASG